MGERSRGWRWGVLFALVAAIGVAVAIDGIIDGKGYLVFGGCMVLLIAVACVIHARALRPGRDGSTASDAERSAWSQLTFGLCAILVLGGMSLGQYGEGKFADYLLFGAFALVVAMHPFFRRRIMEKDGYDRDVFEDERDHLIRTQGNGLSRRLLELSLVALAIFWVLAPRVVHSFESPLQIGALLLLPVLVANAIGEARVAWLHWKDRQ